MKATPLNKLICRTPAFSLTATLPEVLEELKYKILESSPGFFELIKSYSIADLPNLDEKIWFTLWKYFNRAKYRSTPYGSFAAVSLIPLTYGKQDQVKLQREMQTSHYIDWSHKEHFLQDLKHQFSAKTLFLSNSSIYFTGNEIRYLRIKENSHELATVNAIPALNLILVTCKRKTSCAMICELMEATFEMDQENTTALLLQLLDMQLLTTEQFPNITGTDYFERIHIQLPTSANDYIIAKRPLLSGSFDGQHLKHFPEMISFLAKLLPSYFNSDLDRFKQAFLKRFEHQEVSLAKIMDPEIGIGYGNLAQQYGTNPLVDEIKQAKPFQAQATIEYGAFHAFLLNKIVSGLPIALEDFNNEPQQTAARIPNTFSFIFHLYQGQPVIAMAGGCTANALLGRFIMGNKELEDYGQEIAATELAANPEVIFFDIAYQAEKRVDNVNRRQHLYPYELPILTWSTTAEPLDFSDILVAVSGGEVILKSKKMNKRLVPRVPSAYNYTRSDLAVYRFLCDIQYQGLCIQLSFNLQDFFPKLQYYPRVSFKEIIVSPASWLLPQTIFNAIKNDGTARAELLKTWLREQQINFCFKAGQADHTLCFDPMVPEDLQAFMSYCKQQQGDLYISEALINLNDGIKDEFNQLYLPQYIANYHHFNPIYQPLPSNHKSSAKADHIYLPGGDWLYFELYCHTATSNSLLLKQLKALIKNHQKELRKWFFIRYADPAAHIRLRLHLKNKTFGFKLIEALKTIMEPEILKGSVIDLKIKTYFREAQRYGVKRIDLVEKFFHVDSKCILFLLAKASSENQLMASSLNIILTWCELFIPIIEEQISFVSNVADNFAMEMLIGPEHFKKINANFNEIKKDINEIRILPSQTISNGYRQLIASLLPTCPSSEERHRLLADLIHMHINRLFSVDQRMYETIVYHYLIRILKIKKATTKV